MIKSIYTLVASSRNQGYTLVPRPIQLWQLNSVIEFNYDGTTWILPICAFSDFESHTTLSRFPSLIDSTTTLMPLKDHTI